MNYQDFYDLEYAEIKRYLQAYEEPREEEN